MAFYVHPIFKIDSGSKSFREQQANIEETCPKIYDLLYILRYIMWNLRFLTSSKTSLKKVFKGKLLYHKIERYKLSFTCFFVKNTYHSFLDPNFIIRIKKLDKWQHVQVCSSKRDKINKFWQNYNNFLFAHDNLVKLMSLKRKNIRLL